MRSVATKRRQDKRLPRWFIFGVVGLGVSWVVALADWAAVEAGLLHRPLRWTPSFSLGAADEVAVAIHRSHRAPAGSGRDTEYGTRPYGWPFAGWGSVLAQPWIPGGQARCEAVVALDVSPLWPSQNGSAGCMDRFVPVCPLLGPLIFDAAFWGVVCWGISAVRRRPPRGEGRGGTLCEECGYDLTDLPPGAPCPECGEGR